MKASIFASLIASAVAFAPSQQQERAGSALSVAMDEMRGSIDFRRMEFKFDPLKLSETYQPFLPYMRDAEIRNGRTAMLAVLGLIVPSFVRLPGDAYSFENCPNLIEAPFKLGFGPESPMFQIFLWVALWEVTVAFPAIQAMNEGKRDPGGTNIVMCSVCRKFISFKC
jgi:hypothetical protein